MLKNVFFVFFLLLLIFFLYKKKRKHRIASLSMRKIDKMTGVEFEDYLFLLLNTLGWKVEVTKKSGDFGADLLGRTPKRKKCVVQAKRYSKHVPIKAVQEVIGAKTMYDANEAYLITNNYLTKSASILAKKAGVIVWEREYLEKMMQKVR